MIKKISNNEDGIGQLLVIVIVVVVLAVIGFVGYRVVSDNKTKPNSTSSTNSTNNTSTKSGQTASSNSAGYTSCYSSYHDANLCHFASNSLDFTKSAYTATITENSPQGTTSKMTLAADGKGDTSLVATSSGEQLSTISLNGATYIQSSAGATWIEYPAGSAGNPSASTNPTSNMNIGVGSSGITYKAEGTAACGSLTCYKYEISDSAQPDMTQFGWFDTSQYKLREWQSTDSTTGTVTMNITYQAVNITAPSPVKQYGQL